MPAGLMSSLWATASDYVLATRTRMTLVRGNASPRACRRTRKERAYLLADIPYSASHDLPMVRRAAQLQQDGVKGVKVEGFRPDVFAPGYSEVDGWAHLGFTPQLIEKPALQAKDSKSAEQLIEESQQLEQQAQLESFSNFTEAVAQQVSQVLKIPVIGIGAGMYCDGQVQSGTT